MKKIFLSIAIISLITISSRIHAQGVGLGVKGGVNFANQSITDISTESKTGFQGGAYVILAISESLRIIPEVLFSAQGSELPNEISEFNYLSVPVLLSWKPVSFLSFEAGPQFSVLLDATIDGVDVKEDFKTSDFGLGLGTTVHLPLGFNAGLRYVWGFTNVSDLQNDTEVKNSVWQLSVGWTILGAK